MLRPTLVMLATGLLLAACGGGAEPAATTATPASSPKAAEAVPQGQNSMIKECSGFRAHLAPLPAQAGAATKTRVEVERDGQRHELAPPPEMQDYTAVALGCANDGKGSGYLVVQYGELPYGCEFCEWYFLYDARGQLLNHATPPLHGEDGSQFPNNDEYERKLEELGLKHPEMVPFQH